ncbi:MAG: NTP transferase domain-containing protein [Calditrichaeota bacterium]|nr:NTP transferase domain-containing protein [Calditrichota bacterium]
MSKYKIAGIILAVNYKDQMQSPVKTDIPIPALDFQKINTIINKLEEIQCEPIIAITGYDPSYICQKVQQDIFHCVQNQSPLSGELSSLKIAIEQLPEEVLGFILCFMDNFYVKLETLNAIRSMAEEFPDHIVIPQFHGQFGKPLYFGKKFFDVLITTSESASASDILEYYINDIKFLPVNDEAILDSDAYSDSDNTTVH